MNQTHNKCTPVVEDAEYTGPAEGWLGEMARGSLGVCTNINVKSRYWKQMEDTRFWLISTSMAGLLRTWQ